MLDDVVIHIGLHKTGSTSLQAFLADNRQKLLFCGAAFHEGYFRGDNHFELHLLSIRPERETPFKVDSGISLDDGLRRRLEAKISGFCRDHSARIKIFSNEGISYLRHHDEVLRLKHLFDGQRVRIIAYLRNKTDFLASYRSEMEKLRHPPAIDPDSFAYTEAHSWLLDYDKRVKSFQEVFPVEIIDYDREVEKAGSIIPSFLETLGVGHVFQRSEWENYQLNRRADCEAAAAETEALG